MLVVISNLILYFNILTSFWVFRLEPNRYGHIGSGKTREQHQFHTPPNLPIRGFLSDVIYRHTQDEVFLPMIDLNQSKIQFLFLKVELWLSDSNSISPNYLFAFILNSQCYCMCLEVNKPCYLLSPWNVWMGNYVIWMLIITSLWNIGYS